MWIRFFLALSGALFISSQAWACSCIGIDSKSVSEHLGDSTVFVGTPLQTEVTDGGNQWLDNAITTFKVQRGLQGELGETVNIHHGQSGASCGIRFKPGETQMVVAYKTETGLTTGLCSNPLPPIFIVDFFEAQDDISMKSYGECNHERFFAPDPESKYGAVLLTKDSPACEIFTRKGSAKAHANWQAWLDRQYFGP